MYDWYSEYTRTISSDIGDKGFSKEIRIDYINQNTIYAFNEYSKAQIKSISVDGNECELVDSNNNFSKGTIQISFDESCTQNLNSNINEVVVVSDKGTYSTLLSISNSNYVFSNDDDSKDSNGGSEAIINYCPSGSFTYENVLFDYLDIEDGLTKNIVEVNSISGGSKTSYINITCNYPSIDYDSDSFRSSVVCDTGYLLNSLEDSCELITSCNSGDYSFNGELFSYPFLDSGSEYVSVIEEVDSNLVLSKNLGLLCENTIVTNTSYEEVLGCLDGYELEEVKEFLETKITDKVQNQFGYSVSIYEDTLVVGAYMKDNYKGSAYIYEKNSNGEWSQKQVIKANDGSEGDYFGWSVSIYEDTLVVGAKYNDEPYHAGSAYIFEKNSNGEWSLKQGIRAKNREEYGDFGSSVSIYEDTIIVGARTGGNGGSAYIFEKNSNGDWFQKQKIDASNVISIYEDTIVTRSLGNLLIYEKSSNGWWYQEQEVMANGKGISGLISIYEDTIIAGSYGVDDYRGSAFIFERNSNGYWNLKQEITAKNRVKEDYFGISVSIYEDTIVVASRGDKSIYIFEKNENGNYEEIQKIIASDEISDDQFGNSISIYKDVIAVGAHKYDWYKGLVYVYEIGEKETYCKLE